MRKQTTLRVLNSLLLLFAFSLLSYAQPANDECLGAIGLTVNPDLACGIVTAGTTVGATASTEIDDVTGTPDNDVWFTFTATQTSHQVSLINIVAVVGTSTDMGMGLYDGLCGAQTLVDDSDPQTATFTGLTVGTTYTLRVYGWYAVGSTNYAENTFDVCVGTLPPPPGNDDCSSPATLTESPDNTCANIVSGTTISATQSTETILCSTSSNDDDVWYTFTPSQTDDYFFEVSNTSFTTYVNIYSGTCAGGLTSIGSSCFTSNNMAALTMGTSYLVQVYTSSTSSTTTNTFDLCAYPNPFPLMETVTCGTPLAQTHCYGDNDATTWLYTSSDGTSPLKMEFFAGGIESCCDEITIYDGMDNTAPVLYDNNNGGDLTGLVINSTGPNLFFEIDSDASVSCDAGSTCCTTPWDWEVICLTCTPGAGTAVIATCDDVANTFTIDVDVTNIGDGSIVISNDGGVGSTTVSSTGITNIGPFAFPGAVTVTLGHASDPTCDVVLPAITVNDCPPTNDECINAIGLTVNPDLACGTVTAGTTVGATASLQVDDVTGTPDNDVWFSFMATSTTHQVELLNVTPVVGTATDMGMGLYDGTSGCAALVFVDDSDPNLAIFSGLTVGTTYILRVYGWSSTNTAQTDFDVCVGTPPPPPANDECSTAMIITESANPSCGMSVMGTTQGATQSAETLLCTTFSNDDDVWYEFTPSQSIDYVFQLSNITTNTYIHVYTGDCVLGLTNAGACFSTGSQIVNVTAGTTYLVQVHTTSSTLKTDFDLCIYPLTCPDITGLTASNATTTTIDLTWTAGGTETTWDVEVVAAGGTPTGTPTFNDVTTNNPYTVTGLTGSTEYDIYVRADCGMDNTDVSNWDVVFTSTLCLTEVLTCGAGYTQDFDGSAALSCWLISSGPVTGPTGPPIGFPDWSLDEFANDVQQGLALEYNLYNTNNEDWVIGPEYDLSGGSGFMLNFDIALTQFNSTNPGVMGSDDQIQLLISTDGGTTWTSLQTWDATSTISSTGEPVTVDLSAYSGIVQIGFWASPGTVDDTEDVDFYVDNFTIDCMAGGCPDDYAGGGMPGSQPALSGLLDNNADYETDGEIISTQVIGSVTPAIIVDYDTGTAGGITLDGGFEVSLGVEFAAFIDGCGGAMLTDDEDDSKRVDSSKTSQNNSASKGSSILTSQELESQFMQYLALNNVELYEKAKYLIKTEGLNMKDLLSRIGTDENFQTIQNKK